MEGEVARVGEAHRLGNLGGGEVGIGEQGLRPLDALWITYWCGESPVSALNERAKWYGLTWAAPAISASVSFPGRLSFMQSVARSTARLEMSLPHSVFRLERRPSEEW